MFERDPEVRPARGMLASKLEGSRQSAVAPALALGFLFLATVLCLAPFLNKALNIDDPLFVWCAQQIQSHPLDFYGFKINWDEIERPFYEISKNPPLACYFLALAAAVLGFSDVALHAACLLPAVGCITGTYWLARSLCRHPVSAALITLATPVFLVSATCVMSDILMLCGWIWAVVAWQRGLETRQGKWFAVSAVLITLAALTKYPGLNLIPLLAAYSLASDRKLSGKLSWLLLPVAVLGGYELWSRQAYGIGLFSDAASYVTLKPSTSGLFFDAKILIVLSFAGGSLLSALFFLPGIVSRGMLVVAVIVWAVISAYFATIKAPNEFFSFSTQLSFRFYTAIQMGLFVTTGLAIVGLAIHHLVKTRNPAAWLLMLWILGTLVFAGFVNWTCNGRSLLPIAPALGILLVRCLEDAWQVPSPKPATWRWALLPSLAVTLMVAWADMCLANSARTAAATITAENQAPNHTIWFQGHWGFQYYIQQHGGKAVDVMNQLGRPGDLMIAPQNNSNVNISFFRPGSLKPLRIVEFPTCFWLATQQPSLGAGFHAGVWGPMPFVFGPIPTEKYEIWQFSE